MFHFSPADSSLVNSAGFAGPQLVLDITPEQLEKEFSINVFGVVYTTQAVIKTGKMPKGGRIINVGSIASKILPQGNSVYAATKSAQDSLTTAWAYEVCVQQ